MSISGASESTWTDDAPIDVNIYNVRIVVNGAADFKDGIIPLDNYVIGNECNIIYKNYDGTDITTLKKTMPTTYITGAGLTLPTTAPSDDMAG